MTNQIAYDYLTRLTGPLSAVSSGGGGSALDLNYPYNAAGQRAQAAQLVDGSYWLRGYDALGQLTIEALAARLRRETRLTRQQIADRLQMGSRKSVAPKLHAWRKANE